MKLLRHRSEQTAAYLRDQIQRGELTEPLPSTRAWSQKLGVSRPTLEEALHQLEREGLVTIHPRGVRIVSRRGVPRGRSRVVRVLHYGMEHPELNLEWIVPLSERLHREGVELTRERCSAARLGAFAKQKTTRQELFFLASLPTRFQRLFAQHRRPAIVIGDPANGLSLPFVNVDQWSAIQHAVQTLSHRGHSRLWLVTPRASAPGLKRAVATFESACAHGPRRPACRRTTSIPMDPRLLEAAARRLAAQVTGKLGLVVIAPVPVSMLMTALLQRGVAVPGQVELIAVLPTPASIQVSPRLTHYLFPVNRFVKALADAVVRFFETGVVPPLRKTLDVEVVRPKQPARHAATHTATYRGHPALILLPSRRNHLQEHMLHITAPINPSGHITGQWSGHTVGRHRRTCHDKGR